MEAALVTVSMGVIKPLLSKLFKLLGEEHAKLKGVRRDAKFIGDEMHSMQAALETLADEEQLDPEMRIWRDAVRELSYDMEDCVDDFVARVDHDHDGRTAFKKFVDKLKKPKYQHRTANEIGKLKTRATEASERHKRYNIVRPTSDISTCAIDPRLPALYVEADDLIGIDGPKDDIIDWFQREATSTQLQVLSIVGSGGLGKTTLANQVYQAIRGQFSCAAFVSVSRKPDTRKILRDIAKGVGATDSTQDDDVQQLIDKLRRHLKDERYFIVIDDVWSAEEWKTISLALPNNNCGSRIITTTRNNEVASCCSSRVGRVYEMEPLSFGDSKSLFLRRAFGPEDSGYSHLEEVSNEIVRKCSGIPLAIITVSSLLAGQHAEDEWKRVLAAIGSALAKDPGADKMTKILSLSYFDLPHHLRTCLLYLSMFPEDSTIHKQHLIHMWIAEGFIREEQGRSRHAVGESYFNELINRCLIQPVDAEFDQVESCRVHDIILDFITCKAAEENFVTSFNDVEHGHNSHRRVRRIFVGNSNNEKVTIAASPILSHVRSLIVCVQYPQVSLLAFPPALRVLDLGKCWWLEDHHIASIEKLFLLKYLRLANVTLLPRKIGELQYLETLDITKTRILELPSAVTCLQRLTSLYIHLHTSFVDGMIGKMQSLEELMTFGVHSYEQGKSLQELSQLTKLWRLEVLLGFELWEGTGQIEDLHNNIGTLLSSCNLRHLHIRKWSSPLAVKTYFPLSLESWCLATPCSLREFYITYCYIDKVPNWMRLLGNLRELELYVVTVRPEDVAILGSVPTLLFLTLKTFNGTDGRILLHGFSILKYLCLELLYCGTSLEFEAGSMPRLEHLKLEFRVHRMDCLNGSSNFGIQHLSALLKVEVCICCNFGNSENPLAGVEFCFGKYIGSLIETVIMTHPNCSSLLSEYGNVSYASVDCEHYTTIVGTDYEKEDEVGQDAGAHHWHVGGNHPRMSFGYTQNVISQYSSTPEGVFFRWMTLMETHLLPRPVIHKCRRRTALEESTLRTSIHVAARNSGRPDSTIRSCARVLLRQMGIFQEDEEAAISEEDLDRYWREFDHPLAEPQMAALAALSSWSLP